jgi:hypothetical protein
LAARGQAGMNCAMTSEPVRAFVGDMTMKCRRSSEAFQLPLT